MKAVIDIIESRASRLSAKALIAAFYDISMLRLPKTIITKSIKGILTNNPQQLDLSALKSILKSTYLLMMVSTLQERVVGLLALKQIIGRIDILHGNYMAEVLCYAAGLRTNTQLPTFSIWPEIDSLIHNVYVELESKPEPLRGMYGYWSCILDGSHQVSSS